MDLGIVGGKVYIENQLVEANLYIENGKVSAITKACLNCEKEVKAEGKWILPGFIDPHVHFNLTVGTHTSKDDFYRGSVHGALGGVTTYIDFLDPIQKVDQFQSAFETRRRLAASSVTDYAFHMTLAQPQEELARLLKAGYMTGIPSIKLFTTYSDTGRRTYDDVIYKLLQLSKPMKSRIVIHAENDELVKSTGEVLVKDHEKARPVISERAEMLKLAEMNEAADGKLYFVHVSAGSTVEALTKSYAKALKNKDLVLESCPHYFLLNNQSYEKANGYLYTMTPPLRSEEERRKLNESIDEIDVIATDHCPFTEFQKKHGQVGEIPMGIGGIQYSFINMFTLFGEKIIPKFTEAPAKAYGLYPRKGSLLPGADGDLVIFNPKVEGIIDEPESVYHCQRTRGQIERVFLRGHLIVEAGKCLGGKGQYIRRYL